MSSVASLVIRADASGLIGTGHVMRCLALAQAWRERGGRVVFLQAQTTPALVERVRDAGCEVELISASPGSAEDARATAECAAVSGARWVVGDGYGFGADWQARVRAGGVQLLVLDDYGHAAHYHADVVLNQNAGAVAESYAARDAHTRLLLGPAYALLRKEFQEFAKRVPTVSTRALRVLVTLGGADPDNATGVVIEALAGFPGLDVLVVVGAANPHLQTLRRRVELLGAGWTLESAVRDMAERMAWADVAISAAGSTVWELARAGLPAALVITADNQIGIAQALAGSGAAMSLGRHPGLDAAALRNCLGPWLADAAARERMAARLGTLVDGRGARRVCAAMVSSLAISILSDAQSWLEPWLVRFEAELSGLGHRVTRLHEPALLPPGDIALFLSLGRVVPSELLRRHTHNLVVHESALPRGRGWSPLTWQILEGANDIPVTLLEAADGVDAGPVYATRTLNFSGGELVDELRRAQAEATLALCREFITAYPYVASEAREQSGEPSYYPRRRPVDSRLDPHRSIAEQFNLLRVCDSERYPAYFDYAGRRYAITLRPLDP